MLFVNHGKIKITCCRCGCEVEEFSIPNDIWNKVIRPDGHEHDKEYICLNCWYGSLRIALGLSDAELPLEPSTGDTDALEEFLNTSGEELYSKHDERLDRFGRP